VIFHRFFVGLPEGNVLWGFEKSSPLAKVFTRRGVTTPEFQGIEGELPLGDSGRIGKSDVVIG